MKFKLYVDERRLFGHEFIVEAESQKDLDAIIDEIQTKRLLGIHEYRYLLQQKCNVVEMTEDEDGDLSELECTYISEINDSEVEQ